MEDKTDKLIWGRAEVAKALGIALRATYGLDLPNNFTLKTNPSPSAKKFWLKSDIELWLKEKSIKEGNK
ncbi:MAG: hypothetical protein ACR2NF_03240 [Pirellulales bacterium]